MKNNTCSSCCAPAAASRSSHAGLWLLVGLTGGLLGGITLARRKTARREPEGLKTWRRELSKTRGEVEGGFLSARIQAEYEKLYASRPRFDHPALVDHLENSILPGLALYSVLIAASPDRETALAEFDRLAEVQIRASRMGRIDRILKLFPDPFPVFRIAHNALLPRLYPREGWDFHWLEDSDSAIAYDCRDCFYLRVLTAYGVPELTAHFCHGDDLTFSSLPGVAWKRTKTLGRGDDCCNFRFERI